MTRIFISYRRQDTQPFAGALRDELQRRFGAGAVFVDESAIAKATHFPSAIDEHLRAADLVLVLVGPRFLSADTASGRPRIHDDDDWVRRELRDALALGKRILPVLVGGASMPRPADLPADIAQVAGLVAFELNNLASDAVRLGDLIERRFPVLQTAAVMALAAGTGYALRAAQSLITHPMVLLDEFDPDSLRLTRWCLDMAGVSLNYALLVFGFLIVARLRTGWRLDQMFCVLACAAVGVGLANGLLAPVTELVTAPVWLRSNIRLGFWFGGAAIGSAVGIQWFLPTLRVTLKRWLLIGLAMTAMAVLGGLLQSSFTVWPSLSYLTPNPRTLFWGPVLLGTAWAWQATGTQRGLSALQWAGLVLCVISAMLLADLLGASTQPIRVDGRYSDAGERLRQAKQALDHALFFGISTLAAAWYVNRLLRSGAGQLSGAAQGNQAHKFSG